MALESFVKEPVNAILPAHPSGKTAGYSYLNSVNGYRYTLGTDGLWTADTNVAIGATCAVIGDLGDSNVLAHFVKSATVSEILSPYFTDENTYHVHKVVFWQDRIVIARTTGTYTDLLCVFPNGDVTKLSGLSDPIISGMIIDSRGNLWVSTFPSGGGLGGGLTRFLYNPDQRPTGEVFNAVNGQLPNNKIVGITAAGDDVFIFCFDTPDFSIVKYDGFTFTDVSAQFESETGVDVSDLAGMSFYKATQDDQGMLLFSMFSPSMTKNLFYYQAGAFHFKVIPATLTNPVIQDFIKQGNYILCITAANSTPAAGKDTIWLWDDTTSVPYDTDNGNSQVIANGNTPFTMGTAKIYKHNLPAAPVEQTSWEADVLAILTTHAAAAAYVAFAASIDDHVLINLDGTKDAIIRLRSELKWSV